MDNNACAFWYGDKPLPGCLDFSKNCFMICLRPFTDAKGAVLNDFGRRAYDPGTAQAQWRLESFDNAAIEIQFNFLN